MAWITQRRLVSLVAGALAGALLTILWLNLSGSDKHIQERIPHRYGISDPQFLRELGAILGPPIVSGNAFVNLENGVEIFPAMLEAIRGAERSITFETYIYWSGDVGREFADALSERARAGVKVHVLIDWLGSQKMDEALLERMKSAGVQVELFHPLSWYHLGRVNNRTHRKLLVVDGRIGFTGGVGIADNWSGDAQDPEHWRDSHYRAEGPVVAQMQGAFIDNWIEATGIILQGKDYFPPIDDAGDAPAQVFKSSPEGGGNSMLLMYLLPLAAAERSIDLSASYFVPDTLTLRALVDALERGVEVRIIAPGKHIDFEVVRRASRAMWGELLAAGAEIYEYQPTMFHCKTLIVDGMLVSVGSTNFDNRSFRLNYEANLNIYDAAFAARTTAVFENDILQSRRITYGMWKARPWREKLMERAATLLAPQL